MTLAVRIELGHPSHQEDLKAFPCCDDRHVFGSRRRRCFEPWSHTVQSYVRRDALSESRGASGRTRDHRLLLLYDGDVLGGVAAHRLADVTSVEDRPAREVMFLAVRSEFRGAPLSDGVRASEWLLAGLLADVGERDPAAVDVAAAVHTRNRRSRAFLTRHGASIGPVRHDVHPVLIPVRKV